MLQLRTEARNQHLNQIQNIFKNINHNVDMQLCARSHSAGREEALVRCDGFHNISACFLPPKAVTVRRRLHLTIGMFLSFYCQMSNQIVAIRDTVKPTVHMYKMDRPELSPLEPHPNISISVYNYPTDAEVAAGQCQWNHLHSPCTPAPCTLHSPLLVTRHNTGGTTGHN